MLTRAIRFRQKLILHANCVACIGLGCCYSVGRSLTGRMPIKVDNALFVTDISIHCLLK